MMRKTRRVLHAGRWLEFCDVSYDDKAVDPAVERHYECFDRVGHRSSAADGVDVLALLSDDGGGNGASLLLVEQYRPAVDAMCVELPAGLVERGERPEDAALRELLEETGYVGEHATASPLLHADPSITSDSTVLVTVRIDAADPRNAATARRQRCDEDEHISVRVAPLATLRALCDDYARRGWVVDAKVYMLSVGLHLQQQQ